MSGFLEDLSEEQQKTLQSFKEKVPDILKKAECTKQDTVAFGVDMSKDSEARDIILLKYLRARDFDEEKAVTMLTDTMEWRKDAELETLLKTPLAEPFQGHDVEEGFDVKGRRIQLSRYGGMDTDVVFADVEEFVKYRVTIMERNVRKLTFKKGEPEDFCVVHDYKGVSLMRGGNVKKCVNEITKVLSDHYPEFKGIGIFMNFPAIFVTFINAFTIFMPAKTRSKLVFLGEGDFEGLYQYIPPEQLSVQDGGLGVDTVGKAKVETVSSGERRVVSLGQVTKGQKGEIRARVLFYEAPVKLALKPTGAAEDAEPETLWEKEIKADQEEPVEKVAWEASQAGELVFIIDNSASYFRSRTVVLSSPL
mmetsp:Transcript_90015/g.241345  ORF Transcript_90015/g.241345 Transcript_90015/m.241345 type:complete len:364 (+) Transcript_90015:21-1112(+)